MNTARRNKNAPVKGYIKSKRQKAKNNLTPKRGVFMPQIATSF